jgi:glutamate/tyrosine decarboxylase-like PLP-dependent enzyme
VSDPSRDPFDRAQALARSFLASLATRRAGARASFESLRRELGGPLPEEGRDAAGVLEALAAGAERGLVASAGPRYFGEMTGGGLPAAAAADWLVAAWNQNAATFASSPAAAVVEAIASAWVLDLLGLPPTASVGVVTGSPMAHVTCLAAARQALLARAGWDVATRGVRAAPPVRVIAGADADPSLDKALAVLGIGRDDVTVIETDEEGRLDARRVAERIEAAEAAVIVCAQAGQAATGACDPIGAIVDVAHRRGAWVHVDGAFGLWAAAAPSTRSLVEGVARADSWAVEAHSWLNVPYDCALAVVAHPEAHRAALSPGAVGTGGAGLVASAETPARDPRDWVPEEARRARGFALYAALRALGRRGVADLVERSCRHAALMADLLARDPHVERLTPVRLNVVLVRFHPTMPQGPRADADEHQAADACTRAVIERVQRDGTCWASETLWRGRPAMRLTFCHGSTTDEDVRRAAEAILEAARVVRAHLFAS